jgi:phage terminase Nu1 subunit (DNA packaging protein)
MAETKTPEEFTMTKEEKEERVGEFVGAWYEHGDIKGVSEATGIPAPFCSKWSAELRKAGVPLIPKGRATADKPNYDVKYLRSVAAKSKGVKAEALQQEYDEKQLQRKEAREATKAKKEAEKLEEASAI